MPMPTDMKTECLSPEELDEAIKNKKSKLRKTTGLSDKDSDVLEDQVVSYENTSRL